MMAWWNECIGHIMQVKKAHVFGQSKINKSYSIDWLKTDDVEHYKKVILQRTNSINKFLEGNENAQLYQNGYYCYESQKKKMIGDRCSFNSNAHF